MARCLPKQEIKRQDTPYLVRYFVAGWNPQNKRPGPAVFLHHFLGSDPKAEVHSHPWRATSLILVGGYREYRCDGSNVLTVRDCRPGDVNVLEPTDRHRIELLEAECWSLLMVGHYEQPWAFATACA